MSKIIWYQFSDLHFRSDEQFDRERVFSALWADIDKQTKSADFLPPRQDLTISLLS